MENKIKILLVDDHQIVCDGIINLLSREADLEIMGSYNNCNDALYFLAHHQPDIIIADISMPGISGIEFTEIITRDFKNIKVLILSMITHEEYIFNAIKSGAKGYLSKQDSTSEILVQAIHDIVKNKEFYGPSIANIIMDCYIQKTKNANVPVNIRKEQLTLREKEILKLYVEGCTNSEIASELNISAHTVKTHKNNIMLKFNFKNTVELVRFALKEKIVK